MQNANWLSEEALQIDKKKKKKKRKAMEKGSYT